MTRKELFKFILSSPNGVIEPDIRKYLADDFGITGIRGIKLHLENLEKDNIIYKRVVPGGPNTWFFNICDFEAWVYLSEYISSTTWDADECDLISAVFRSNIPRKMIEWVKPTISTDFIVVLLPQAFKVHYIGKYSDEEKLNPQVEDAISDYFEAMAISPSLFTSLGFKHGHKSLLVIMALLIGENRYMFEDSSDFVRWLAYYAICAGFISDMVFYPQLKENIMEKLSYFETGIVKTPVNIRNVVMKFKDLLPNVEVFFS